MLRKLKNWFLERFLPMWAKESLLKDCRQMEKELASLRQELARKDAYISGMAAGMKYQRRIVINTTEGKG